MERYWGVDNSGNPYQGKQAKGYFPPSTSKPLDRYNPLLAMSVRRWMKNRGKTVKPKLTEEQTANLQMCFKMMDADGSGAIDADELHAAFKLLGLKTTKKEVEAMLDEVDRDGSGEVEWAEFLEIMTVQLHKMAAGQNERRSSSPDDEEAEEGDGAGKEGEKNAPDAAALPFDIVATAYRRKKLLEALDQDNKQFLREVAEEEEERRATEAVASPAANSSKPSSGGVAQEESSFANNYAANMGELLGAETNEKFLHLMAKDQKRIIGTLLNRFRESQEAARAAATAQGQQRRKTSVAIKAVGGLTMRVAPPLHGGVQGRGSSSSPAGYPGSRHAPGEQALSSLATLSATPTSDCALGAQMPAGSHGGGRLAGRPWPATWQPGIAAGRGKGEGAEEPVSQTRSTAAARTLGVQQGLSTGAAPLHVAASDWQEEQQLASSIVHESAVDEVLDAPEHLGAIAARPTEGHMPAVGWVVPAAGVAALHSPTTAAGHTRTASPLHGSTAGTGGLAATPETGENVGSALEVQFSAAEAAPSSELDSSGMLAAAHLPPSREPVVARASGLAAHLSPRGVAASQPEARFAAEATRAGAKRAAGPGPHVRFAEAVCEAEPVGAAEDREEALAGEEALGAAAEARSELEAGPPDEMSDLARPHHDSLATSTTGPTHRSIIAFRRATAPDLNEVYSDL